MPEWDIFTRDTVIQASFDGNEEHQPSILSVIEYLSEIEGLQLRSVIPILFLSVLVFSVSAAESDTPWSPEAPDRGSDLSSDWVQLKHGDWLIGEFLSLRDGLLVFNSEEFGELSLKWKDIRGFHSAGDVLVVLQDGRVLVSRISVSSDELRLLDQKETVNRGMVISIVPAGSRWWELWNGRVTAGLNLRSGNTRQVDLQIKLNSVLRTAFNRFNFMYLGNFSRVHGTSIANSNNAVVSWNYFINYRMYIIPFAYDFVSDPFRNIRQQHTPTFGFGYELINTNAVEWDLLGGAGYRYLEYNSVEMGQNPFSQSVVLQLGTKVSADITDSTEVDFSYKVNFDLINLKNIVHNLSTQLYVDITNNLELDVMFAWSRVGDPERREDGSLPDKDDLSLTAGVSFEY